MRLFTSSFGKFFQKSLEDFKNKIRIWEPDGGDRKLCKDFVSNLGYVNLV